MDSGSSKLKGAKPAWASMRSAPRDGTLVLVRLRASEQGPAEVDSVRFAKSARSGEESWVANDSDPFARVVYSEGELAGWMPLPGQLPKPRPALPPAPSADSSEPPDEADGSAI